MLRQTGFNTPKSKPSGNSKPVDVKGSIIQPPSKATMRPASPRGSSAFEADRSVAEIRADRAKFGGGQAKPKAKKPSAPNTKEAVKKRRADSAAANKNKMTDEIKRIRQNIAKAKTPADKARFQQQLTNLVIKTASDRAVGRGKYAGTRPLRNR
jgi:hypothetical protein